MAKLSVRRFGLLSMCTFLLGIKLSINPSEARHVALSTKATSGQSGPRLLVIRPPAGSGQPNRVVVLANPRPAVSESSSRTSTKGADTASPLSVASAEAAKSTGRSFGVHPQSRARTTESTGSPDGSRRSIRNLLEILRKNQRKGSSGTSNIARVSETVPRAAAPLVPTSNRFGDINIPDVIKAALLRLRQQARQFNRLPSSSESHVHGPAGGTIPETPSPFRGGTIDLTNINVTSDVKARTQAPRNSVRETSRPRSLFSFSKIQQADTPRQQRNRSPNTGINHGRAGRVPNGMVAETMSRRRKPSSGRRNADVSASLGRNGIGRSSVSEPAVLPINKSAFLGKTSRSNGSRTETLQGTAVGILNQALEAAKVPVASAPVVTPITDAKLRSVLDTSVSKPAVGVAQSQNTAATNDVLPNANPEANLVTGTSGIVASVNASANVSSTSAQSNTTSTKSIKTKTITMTTVVKGGTAADVAAAAASQAEIVTAVAQGKEINSSNIAALSASATKKPPTNAGSITVKREPDGVSIITLSDGNGEPVILRTTGPVKIDRIVKPNGQIQFLINPIKPKPVDPELELDPEELITTTPSSLMAHLNLTTGMYPDFFDVTTASTATSESPSTTVPVMSTTAAAATANTSPIKSLQPETAPSQNTMTGLPLKQANGTVASKEALQAGLTTGSSEVTKPMSILPSEMAGGTVLDPLLPLTAGRPDTFIPPPPLFSGRRIPRPPPHMNPSASQHNSLPSHVTHRGVSTVNNNVAASNSGTNVIINKDSNVHPATDAMPLYKLITYSPTGNLVPGSPETVVS